MSLRSWRAPAMCLSWSLLPRLLGAVGRFYDTFNELDNDVGGADVTGDESSSCSIRGQSDVRAALSSMTLDVNLDIRHVEFRLDLRRLGCGKSTLFNAVYGLLKITEGRILLDGRTSTGGRARPATCSPSDATKAPPDSGGAGRMVCCKINPQT
jgi:hypothetical protein